MLIYFSLNNEHLLCLLWIFIEWITTKNILKSTHLQGVQALLPILQLVHSPPLQQPQKSRTRKLAIQVKPFILCSYIFEFLKPKPLSVRGIKRNLHRNLIVFLFMTLCQDFKGTIQNVWNRVIISIFSGLTFK